MSLREFVALAALLLLVWGVIIAAVVWAFRIVAG